MYDVSVQSCFFFLVSNRSRFGTHSNVFNDGKVTRVATGFPLFGKLTGKSQQERAKTAVDRNLLPKAKEKRFSGTQRPVWRSHVRFVFHLGNVKRKQQKMLFNSPAEKVHTHH